jgi:hypothetical protein
MQIRMHRCDEAQLGIDRPPLPYDIHLKILHMVLIFFEFVKNSQRSILL